jgi:energy-coupling factor transport system substrate-specific component
MLYNLAEKYPLNLIRLRPAQGSVLISAISMRDLPSLISLLIRITMLQRLTLAEITFITILATAMGIAWWAYSFIYDILDPVLKTVNLSGLLEGWWHLGGVFFAYVIRKPGAALLGETLAATIEGAISQWGFSAVLSGLAQGLPVELWFFCCRYQRWNRFTAAIGGMLSALGGYAVTYWWYQYSAYSLSYNLVYLTTILISAAVFGGLGGRSLALRLAKAGVLNQYQICHAHHDTSTH